jgi:2-desacetyl-2-hydroxyethyl bacteriochlorophyllide A dehydrogenase
LERQLRAAVLRKPFDLTVEDVEDTCISPNEVRVRIKAAGICGTDIHVYRGAFPNVHFPIIPGHEYAGEIEEVGSNVEQIKTGNSVIGEGSWSCGKCRSCRNRQPNSCANLRRLGRTIDGAFAQYVNVPAGSVHILPKNIQYENAQSVTTLAGVMRGMKRLGVDIGDTVAILGPGHVGLLFLQVAKAVASRVFLIGTKKTRLMIGEKMGADAVIDITSTNPAEKIMQLTDGKGIDVVIEASGSPTAINQAIKMVKPGGKILFFGTPEKLVDGFDATRVEEAELTIIGTRGGRDEYESAIALLASGKVSVTDLITHKFSLEDIARGYEIVDKRNKDVLRVVITP